MTTSYVLTLPDRLLARRVLSPSDCWEWAGCRRNGYGRVSVKGRLLSVHRLAAAIWIDGFDYDSPLKVCHWCDNPPCFNPEHLFIGSQAENMGDAARKGRTARQTDPRQSIHARIRSCDVCGDSYAPHPDHRGRSRVCSADCLARLRSKQHQGRGHKLTADAAEAIRDRLSVGAKGVDVAREFGVSPATVSLIRSGKIWGQV